MKNKLIPHNVDELKKYLEDNGLTDDIASFKLKCKGDATMKKFGMDLPETYDITITLSCTIKDDLF